MNELPGARNITDAYAAASPMDVVKDASKPIFNYAELFKV